MPMPSYVNERPVKTGCWTEREDELLAEWQGKYGNRCVCNTIGLSVTCVSLPHYSNLQCCSCMKCTLSTFDALLQMVHGSQEDSRQDRSAVCAALASQGRVVFTRFLHSCLTPLPAMRNIESRVLHAFLGVQSCISKSAQRCSLSHMCNSIASKPACPGNVDVVA